MMLYQSLRISNQQILLFGIFQMINQYVSNMATFTTVAQQIDTSMHIRGPDTGSNASNRSG